MKKNHILGTKGDDPDLIGTSGDDLIIGRRGNDIIRGGDGNDKLIGNNGNDQLFGEANNDKLIGGGGNDVLDGGTGGDELDGDEGNDTLFGGAGFDKLTGGAGNDTLDGGTNLDAAMYLSATSGVTLDLNFSTSQVTGGAGTDTLVFSAGLSTIEHITGSPFDDIITGNAGNNILQDGGGGNDILDGGAGVNDFASYLFASSGVYVNLNFVGTDPSLNPTIDPLGMLNGAGDDILIGIESASGSNFADTLIGNAGVNLLVGNDGDDTLIGGDGNDSFDSGKGNDSLDGGPGPDTAIFAVLVDQITFEIIPSTTSVFADLAFYDATTGKATGADIDSIGVIGVDTLFNIENVLVSAGNDSLYGSDFANNIGPGAGNDYADGRLGTDTVSYSIIPFGGLTTGVYVNLNLQGVDPSLNPTVDPMGILNGAGDDILLNFENITGTNGFGDVLIGDGNANVLSGQIGNDTLIGGTGNDTLIGGANIDTFVFAVEQDGASLGIVGNDSDTVTDLVLEDVLRFTGVINVNGDAAINEADLDFNTIFNSLGNIGGTAANDTVVTFAGGGVTTFFDIIFASFTALEALDAAVNNVLINGG